MSSPAAALSNDVPESVTGTEFVLHVEDNDDLRELVVELVTAVLKHRCVGVGSYEELVGLGDEALGCSVAILDINLGSNRRSGIDAYACRSAAISTRLRIRRLCAAFSSSGNG